MLAKLIYLCEVCLLKILQLEHAKNSISCNNLFEIRCHVQHK